MRDQAGQGEHEELGRESEDLRHLCYVLGELSGKVELLLGKIGETMASLVTERKRIDSIDRRLSSFAVVGPILTVVTPAIISVGLALMMRPPADRGLTEFEVQQLRIELHELRQGEGERHFQTRPGPLPPSGGQRPR